MREDGLNVYRTPNTLGCRTLSTSTPSAQIGKSFSVAHFSQHTDHYTDHTESTFSVPPDILTELFTRGGLNPGVGGVRHYD